MLIKYSSGLLVVCLLAGNALAVDESPPPGERIAPKRIELQSNDYKVAKRQAIAQRKTEFFRVPAAPPLVAQVQADGSIVYHHGPVPERQVESGRKPQ